MKKWLMLLLMGLLLFGVAGCGDDEPGETDDPNDEVELDPELPAEYAGMAEGDVFITSIGQSADLDTIWNLLSNVYDNDNEALEADVEMDALLEANQVEAGSVVLLVPGASSKGMGAAGTDQAAEENRAEAFAARAQAGEITIITMHTGGMQRRGVESDPLIEASMAESELTLITNGGNDDDFFSELAEEYDRPLYVYSGTAQLIPPLRTIFSR
ncbi:MAG: DUF6305 family protein [Acholeplasmataceae bacterium]